MFKCWICVDTGFIEHYQKFKIHGEIVEYTVKLHCSCEKGYMYADTEPIGKYFDIFKLQEENKKKFGYLTEQNNDFGE